jgi:hypothetical protein
MVADDTALARTDYPHQENQCVVVNQVVAAPPRNGHRSMLATEVLRRRTQVNDAETLRDAIELGDHARGISGSPGA